jgi:hypothetical protein
MLKALVILPNANTQDVGALVAIARCEARKREHAEKNPPIRALRFIAELNVYVFVYESLQEIQNREVNK